MRTLWPWCLAALIAGCGDSSFKPKEYLGQCLLINYWAEWCKPCIKEIPELEQANKTEGVSVIAVNFDGLEGEALALAANKLDIDLTQVHAKRIKTFDYPPVRVLPTTLVINRQGQFDQSLVGPQTEQQLLTACGVID